MRLFTKKWLLLFLAVIVICVCEISTRIMERAVVIAITYTKYRSEESFTQLKRSHDIENQHEKIFSSKSSANEIIAFYRRWFGYHFTLSYFDSMTHKGELAGKPFTTTKQAYLSGKYLQVAVVEGYWEEDAGQKVTYVFLSDYMFN